MKFRKKKSAKQAKSLSRKKCKLADDRVIKKSSGVSHFAFLNVIFLEPHLMRVREKNIKFDGMFKTWLNRK